MNRIRLLWHPSSTKLHRWVEGNESALDRHLATCSFCADRLEPMIDESDGAIRAALLELLVVPDQLPDRLRMGISKRLSDQRDIQLISEFFALPFQTARLMTSTSEEGDD